MVPIDFDTFQQLFAGPVRTGWDLGALRRHATVHLDVVAGIVAIGCWWLPWYEDEAGHVVSYDDVQGHPIRVAAAAARDLGADRETAVTAATDQLRWAASFMAVTYEWGSGDQVLLDGCHRAIATLRSARADRPVTVAQFRVTGPLDPDVVADTTWWARR